MRSHASALVLSYTSLTLPSLCLSPTQLLSSHPLVHTTGRLFAHMSSSLWCCSYCEQSFTIHVSTSLLYISHTHCASHTQYVLSFPFDISRDFSFLCAFHQPRTPHSGLLTIRSRCFLYAVSLFASAVFQPHLVVHVRLHVLTSSRHLLCAFNTASSLISFVSFSFRVSLSRSSLAVVTCTAGFSFVSWATPTPLL